jgi:hypothetical protein
MPIEVPLRASALYAGIEIAREREASGRSPEEALAFIREGPAARNSFDYEAAFSLAASDGWHIFSAKAETSLAFRETITAVLERAKPTWVRVLPAGRRRVTATLPPDVLQCLEIAELLGYEPEVVAWWDRLAALGRLWSEESRVAIGRKAEQRAMEYEKSRLAGTNLEPRWVAVEDNGAGYDIQTWRPQASDSADQQTFYVEVKGSSVTGIVHIGRSEWDFALAHAGVWELQLWLPERTEPLTFSTEALAVHIPTNNGDGRWAEVEIATDRLLPPAPSGERRSVLLVAGDPPQPADAE